MAGLPGHDAPAHLSLRVMHRDATLRALHIDDDRRHAEHQHQQNDGLDAGHLAGINRFDGTADRTRQSGDDARKDEHGDAVSDAALGHLLPKPHQEHGPGGHGDGGDEEECPTGLIDHAAVLQRRSGAQRLEHREENRTVACDLGELAPT